MIKIITVLILAVLFSLPPFITAQAQTSDLGLTVQQLQQRVFSLEKQLGLNTAAFTETLRLGAAGNQVRELQQFLKQLPDVYPSGLVTGYFGTLTESAVKRFQREAIIGAEATGVVGPITRAKLNELVVRRTIIPALPDTGTVGIIGATGATGLTGATGQRGGSGGSGSTGATGQAGDVGATGLTGETGSAGETGATGSQGATGEAGTAGTTGSQGATGSAGQAGSTGAQGSTGQTGSAGAQGSTGATGTTGPAGPQGSAGPTGATGPAGADGTFLTSGYHEHTVCIKANGEVDLIKGAHGGNANCPGGDTEVIMVFKNH